jgi:8-oxo-dGTP diphosphatase
MKAAVGVAGIIPRGKTVLVLRRSLADRFLPGAWDLPGGGLEPGEPPEEGIVREVLEETGLHVRVVQILGSKNYMLNPDTGERNKVMIVYLLRSIGSLECRLSSEHDEFRWVPVSEVDKIFGPNDLMGDVIRLYFESG